MLKLKKLLSLSWFVSLNIEVERKTRILYYKFFLITQMFKMEQVSMGRRFPFDSNSPTAIFQGSAFPGEIFFREVNISRGKITEG